METEQDAGYRAQEREQAERELRREHAQAERKIRQEQRLGEQYAEDIFSRPGGAVAVGFQIDGVATARVNDFALKHVGDIARACLSSMVTLADLAGVTKTITTVGDFRCISVCWGDIATSVVVPFGESVASKSIQRTIRVCMRRVYHVEES